MKKFVAASAALAVVAVAPFAFAQDVAAFDAKGTLSINAQGGVHLYSAAPGDDAEIGLTPFVGWTPVHSASDPSNDRNDYFTRKTHAFYINPGADYFIFDHLSLGGEVLLAFTGSSVTTHHHVGGGIQDQTGDGPSTTHIGLFPRIGYNVWLGGKFSLWPRGGIGFRTASTSQPNRADTSDTLWFFSADVPFLFHPVPHFFLGLGPGLTISLSHRRTTDAGNGTSVSGDGPSIFDFRLFTTTFGGYF